jgi:prepilin-type processing-associated H-X9-DG protein/prepilin-type N-terminal cleavage/methylation domain-containing protein
MRRETAAPGFSVVELLVVLAIVAVLTLLVATASQQVMERAESAACVRNLQQVAGAALAYAAEHDGMLPAAQDPTNRLRWHGVRESENVAFDPREGPLVPYLGKDGRIKQCPALKRVLKGSASFEEGAGGYGYNATYLGGTPADPFTPSSLAVIENARRTLMFADTAFGRRDGLQEYPFAEPWRAVDRMGNLRGALAPSVHFRHGGMANVAWADGGVTQEAPTRLGGKNYYGGDSAKLRLGWVGDEQKNGVWNPVK